MMWWSDDKIRLYEIAASASCFHDELASLISQHLNKNETIYELGCGLGYITSRLNDKGYNITGLDSDNKAISFAKNKFPSASYILGDAFNLDISVDVIICVFFGRLREEDNLNKLFSLCKKRIIYIQNEHAGSLETEFERSKETAEYLKQRGVSFSYTTHRLSFDQPLKDEEELSIFLRENYKTRDINIKIEKENNGFIARNNKAFGLFEIIKGE